MTTPTIRMLERQLPFKRQQDEARANRPTPTPDDLYRLGRHRLRLDPAAARRFAGLEEPPPFVPPAVESMPPDWRSIAGGLMRNIEEMYQQSMQRSAPRVAEPDDVAPAASAASPATMPASMPTPSSRPREIAIHRDIDGRITHATAGDDRINFMRGRDGKIERAESDGRSIIYKRGPDGRIAGARIEEKL